MPQIGDEFRAARLARHLSLSEVSEQIHIRSVYLEAIEAQEWALIGAPVYVRGFIRTYARFLGLDPEAAVAHYNAERGPDTTRPGPERRYRRRRARGGPSVWFWSAVLAAAVLVGLVGYDFFQLHGLPGGAARVVAASPSPRARHAAFVDALATSRPGVRGPAAAGSSTLELRLTEASWVAVSIDGSKRLEGTFPAGTRKAFHGRVADVRTGNAGAVELTVNGKELGTMGRSGGVAERRVALAEE